MDINSKQNTALSDSQGRKVIAWIPYWDQQNAKNSFTQHPDGLNYISLFWYKVSPDGALARYDSANEDLSIIDFAHKNNVKAFALVANLADRGESGGWDAGRVDKVISTPDARRKHIEDLLTLIENRGFDGIDIDYENLRPDQRDNFSAFIEELSSDAHKKGKLVGVAIHPKTSEDNPSENNGSHAQDLTRLAKAADQLYFMTYLEHGSFSNPGPPGSINWIKQVLSYALDTLEIPKEKVYMGVGLMGIAWRQNPDGTTEPEQEELTFSQIQDLVSAHGIQPSWDDTSRTPFLSFDDQYGKHTIWFENESSISQRFDLAKSLNAGGIALWRLGGEDQSIWQNLKTFRNR